MTNRTLVFHHIPKTAGSTFYSVLENQYTASERFLINGTNPADSLKKFSSISHEQRKDIKLIYGHLADQFLSMIANPLYTLFLREPIDHFISSYYYIRRSPFNRFHNEVKGMDSIERFIDLRKRENLDNLQTRHIAGDVGFLLNPNLVPMPSAHLDSLYTRAKKRLEETDFVLLTEYFDESLMVLYESLNWKSMPYYKVRNKTRNRPMTESFSKEILLRIKEICSWDIQLYKLAKEHFCNAFNPTAPSFQTRVKKFKVTNRLIGLFG